VLQSEAVTSRVSEQGPDARSGTARRWSWQATLPWVMALAFASLYATISVARFERLAFRSFDLGIFEQAVRAYAHLQAPIVDIEGAGHNFLGDHWSPAIAVFAPFYRLFPTPVTLLVGQAVAIALGVVAITRAGIRHLGRWPGVAVGLAFGMSYGIQSAVDFDVHEVALAVPLLAFGLEALLARRWLLVVAWVAPLVLVKEDLGLTVAAVGLLLVVVGARRWGIALALFGLASAALTMLVLIPHFNTGGRLGSSRLGALPGSGSVGQRILDLAIELVTPGPKATTVLLLLVVTAFLAVRSPLAILVVPTLAWRLVSANQNFGGQSFHYDLVLMPIIFAAFIDGAVRSRGARWAPMRWYARAAPALVLGVGIFFCTRYAFKDLVNPATYRPSPRAQAADRVLAQIPDGASVESDLGLISELTSRTRVFYVGSASPVVPQYLLFDDKAGWNPPLADPVRYAESLHPGATYVLVTGGDGYRLLRRTP
jgi:uncharacterized membrane protein